MTVVHLERKIKDWPRNEKGLFLEPTLEQYRDPDFQTFEQHNRDRAAAKADFADKVTGNPHTVDPKGTYLCRDCNQADGYECLLMNMRLLPGGKISLDDGSCGKWEIICAGDAEVRLHHYSPIHLGYARSAKGRFGCKVCPLGWKARVADSLGRDIWCAQHVARVFGGSCCNDNDVQQIRIRYTLEALGMKLVPGSNPPRYEYA